METLEDLATNKSIILVDKHNNVFSVSVVNNRLAIGIDHTTREKEIKKLRVTTTRPDYRLVATNLPKIVADKELAETLVHLLNDWIDYGVLVLPGTEDKGELIEKEDSFSVDEPTTDGLPIVLVSYRDETKRKEVVGWLVEEDHRQIKIITKIVDGEPMKQTIRAINREKINNITKLTSVYEYNLKY